MIRRFALLALLFSPVSSAHTALAQALPVFSDTGPDAAAYGAAQGYPVAAPETRIDQRTIIGSYSHFDQFRLSRSVPAAPQPSKLARAPQELQLDYQFQGKAQTIDSYLERNPATGLLVLAGRTILYEHYRYARTDKDRFTSQSMAKTVVAMLVGIAVSEGAIGSLDDLVSKYLPELATNEVGRTPLRALLSMTSGMHFHEVYDGKDDIMRLSRSLMRPNGGSAIDAVAQFGTRAQSPGEVFNYSGLDTELLGLVLTRATGMPLATYVAERIWAPIGAEAAASWTIDSRGQEVAYCCFNAVLRDWGRLGVLLANDGAWEGRQIIPRPFLLDATTPSAPFLAPGNGRRLGYGYQVWLVPGERRQFVLRGIYGQTMLIDPQTRTVLVHTAARSNATNNVGDAELMALWNALVAQRGS
jgi:CubicO group peptidase (beta-lactamase class C family)